MKHGVSHITTTVANVQVLTPRLMDDMYLAHPFEERFESRSIGTKHGPNSEVPALGQFRRSIA